MMVVVAIIALLLAALLPAFSAVKNQAKYAQANAQFKALDTGINAFRAEAALGGALPPSSSDDKDHRQKIANPKGTDPNSKFRVAGAHLLVHAMMGADGIGTPGFRDVSKPADGRWSDDTHSKKDVGIYALGDDGKEKFPRYGGAGYVDEKMKERAESIQDQVNEGKVLPRDFGDVAVNERMFMDPWDHPILYYKASPTNLRMTSKTDASPPKPGIYWQEDNGIITGTDKGLFRDEGLDFGQGKEANYYHNIAVATGPEPTVAQDANWIDTVRTDPAYDHSFARFILDGSVKARPTPVQKDSYLLISAGPDARYGTDDDVLNWTRKTD
jgi:type II secretory pathway pseudopilin PulG